MPVWLKGRPADCLFSETVARDPRTGTILRGDNGGATSVSFTCAIGRGRDRQVLTGHHPIEQHQRRLADAAFLRRLAAADHQRARK